MDFKTLAEGYTTREETLNERTYLVVPVVALVEGVVHAMNAEHPELVTLEEFGKTPVGFNGKPLFHGHPMRDGQVVFGSDPEVIEAEAIGLVFNAGIKREKLTMEAWIDIERCAKIAPRLLERARNLEPIEISVGVAAETADEQGKFGSKKYDGKWLNIMPDHLALLPEDSVGACSREMGCGVRAAQAKGDTDVSEKKSLFARVMGAIRAALPADEMSDNDVRAKLYQALVKVEGQATYVEAVYDDYFVYCVYAADYSSSKTFKRSYTLGEDGAVAIGTDPAEVEVQLIYELKVKAAETKDTVKAASCSCHAKAEAVATQENKTMAVEKKDRVSNLITKLPALFTAADEAFLGTASDDQLARFEAAIPAEAAPVVAETKVETKVEAAVEAPKTVDEVIAAAPEALRGELGDGVKAARALKAAAIAKLKASGRCDIADKDLESKSQAELDQLVKLAGEVKAAASVDFSGQGAPRPADETKGAPAAPDFIAEMKAASDARNKR